MLNRIYAIIKKEFRQIKRDVRTLILIFFFPVFLLMLFGYALNLDVKNIKIAIDNRDNSPESREFVQMLQSSGYFNLVGYIYNEKDIGRYLDEKLAQCVIVIPNDLAEKLGRGEKANVQFLVDGVDGNTATVIMNYMNLAARFYSGKIAQEFSDRSGFK
ncbi:MAG TPA: ABC transporter permease, partial [Ignavibacteria bacterium]